MWRSSQHQASKKKKETRKLDESIEKQKALVIIDGKPIIGEVLKVKVVEKTGKVFVTLLTKTGKKISFEAMSKLRAEQFQLISEEVYSMLYSNLPEDSPKSPKSPKRTSKAESGKTKKPGKLERMGLGKFLRKKDGKTLDQVKIGSIVETMVLSGRHRGIWVKCQVLGKENDTMDLKVLAPKKWRVATTALAVPNRYIRPSSKSALETYVVPIEFTMDDTKLYFSCHKKMKLNHLRMAIAQERGLSPKQLFFINRGKWLDEDDPIPNDVLFCIIHRKNKLSPKQLDMVSAHSTPWSPNYNSSNDIGAL